MTIAHIRLQVPVSLTGGPGEDLPSTWTWTAAEPWAVSFTLHYPTEKIAWTFARQLLADALYGRDRQVGAGDVRIFRWGWSAVRIRLHGEGGSATLQAPVGQLRKFLDETQSIVRIGREHVDVDAVVARILAGGR